MLVWNGQKMVDQPETVTPYVAPPDPYAQQIPPVTQSSVNSGLASVRLYKQSWTGTTDASITGSQRGGRS